MQRIRALGMQGCLAMLLEGDFWMYEKKTLWMYECIHCYIVNVKLKTLWMYECIGVCIGNAWGSALWMHGGLHRISFWSQFRFIRCSTKSIRLELLSCDDDMRTELHLINAKRLRKVSWILNFNFSLKSNFKYNLKLNFKYNLKFNFNFNFSVLSELLSKGRVRTDTTTAKVAA